MNAHTVIMIAHHMAENGNPSGALSALRHQLTKTKNKRTLQAIDAAIKTIEKEYPQ